MFLGTSAEYENGHRIQEFSVQTEPSKQAVAQVSIPIAAYLLLVSPVHLSQPPLGPHWTALTDGAREVKYAAICFLRDVH